MIWDLDPTLLRNESGLEIRYYGVLFLLGFGLAITATAFFAKRAGIERLTGMLAPAAIAAFVGAHLAHLALYEPGSLSDPVRVMQLGSGLASHGALLGALLALAVFAVVAREDVRACFDAAASGVVFAIPFVRLGNLTNSELVGTPWDGPWAFTFPRYDCLAQRLYPELAGGECLDAVPRHPWPLYAALAGVALIGLTIALWKRWSSRKPGQIFLVIFGAWLFLRFTLGFVHEPYAPGDAEAWLTMEQWASLASLPIGLLVLLVARSLQRPADPA